MDSRSPMARGVHLYRLGLAAAAIGLLSLLLPFATVRASRIQTGHGVSTLDALGPALTASLALLWLVVAVASIVRSDTRTASLIRGWAAAVDLAALLAASGYAASTLGPLAGQFARVSVGGGVWLAGLAAYTLLRSARREVGRRTLAGIVVGLAPVVAIAALLWTGYLDDLGMMKEYANVADRFWIETWTTAVLAAISVAIATVVGVGLGAGAFVRPSLRRPTFAVVNVFQTIPGLAMVGLLVAPLAAIAAAVPLLRAIGFGGLGWAPVVVALTLYALLPIVRNTHTGLEQVPVAATDAGLGMGMTGAQLMRRVRVPLAAPVMLSGVRTSSVQSIGNATLGAFVGGITLGRFVFQGLAEQSPDLVMLGSIGLVGLAIATDVLLRGVQRLLTLRRPRRVRPAPSTPEVQS